MNTFISCDFAHELSGPNFEAHNPARHSLPLDQCRHTWPGHPQYPIVIPINLPVE